MKNNIRNTFISSISILGLYNALPTPVNAACTYSLAIDSTPTFGAYIPCLIGNLWGFLQIIFVAVGVILLMINIFTYLYNRSNPKALEAYPSKFMYIIAFFLLSAGFGVTLIDIFLNIMGLGGVANYLNDITTIFEDWDAIVK